MKPVIILDHIFVNYRAPESRANTFKEYAIQLIKRQVRIRDFKALSNVSLQINEGEIIGIIGRNGAGKSTLLKVVSRVLIPTQGRVRLRGWVSPLLELGAGFHPELTGRENIFLNGTLLGKKRRELETKLDQIIEFADLDSFIDSPMRTYSSGMIARLGFSIATTWKPDILILDEILSVGDENFRNKCRIRIDSYQKLGTTTLLVSHNSNNIETMCSRAVWLDHGVVKADGAVKDVVALYRQSQSSGTAN
jgi:ABC-type polysaccharide/polyol phosphate transport system ATPase subunit